MVYVITDTSGNPVSGINNTIMLQRVSDDRIYDFADSTFKSSGWTTNNPSMTYESTMGYYYTDITMNDGTLATSDFIMCVQNDDLTYNDQQCENIHFGKVGDMIKTHR